MTTWGWVLALIGVVAAVFAINMDVSVSTTLPSIYGTGSTTSDTLNLGLLQRQLMAFGASAVLFLAGMVLIGLGELQKTMVESRAGIARLLKRGLSDQPDAIEEAPRAYVTSSPQADIIDPVREAAREEEAAKQAQQADVWMKWFIGGLVALGLAVVALLLLSPDRAGEASRAQANAAALADNLEAEADALVANAQ